VTVLLIALGAGLGAPARYLTDRAVQAWRGGGFPWGTLLVNVAASLLLGAVTGAGGSPRLTALVGTGFCGALSTYSTFSYETLRLAAAGARRPAVLNVTLSLVAGIGAAALGWSFGRAVA
jgi:CrcB protein